MTDNRTYPIAEIFHSLQGEGVYTGTPMMFIRLAGCNVGEYMAEVPFPRLGKNDGPFPIIHDPDLGLLQSKKHSICTAISGERFLCDTDYHSYHKMTVGDLLTEHADHGRQEHICITGGEPFIHDLLPLITAFQGVSINGRRVMAHIETSGTKPFPPEFVFNRSIQARLWVTCSPKKGLMKEVLPVVDEFKILVGDEISESWLERFIAALESYPRMKDGGRIFIQPINGVFAERDSSLENCLRLTRKYPQVRLSAQLHKYIHQR